MARGRPRDHEVEFLHHKLEEYEGTIADLQSQLDDEIAHRQHEKVIADAAYAALEQRLRLREDELRTMTIHPHGPQGIRPDPLVPELRREVQSLRRALQQAEEREERWAAMEPRRAAVGQEDVMELSRILRVHMGCSEGELQQLRGDLAGILDILESRALVMKESITCLATFISELGQLVYEEAGAVEGLPHCRLSLDEEMRSLVTQRATADLHQQLRALMMRCEDLITITSGRHSSGMQPYRAQLVKAVQAAHHSADHCSRQTKATINRCLGNSSYGRFPREHRENLRALDQLAASTLERLQFIIDRCLMVDERMSVRAGRTGSPGRSPSSQRGGSRGPSPERRMVPEAVPHTGRATRLSPKKGSKQAPQEVREFPGGRAGPVGGQSRPWPRSGQVGRMKRRPL
eukprot:GGOE01000397.1.p1 GENE.GGOE01000397.1~~GGOE01000397.1.p1  ORF type:complete len:424 (-),score=99.69 GGOE01000397.1:261-1475(-)